MSRRRVSKLRSNHNSKETIPEKVNNHFWFSDRIVDWMPDVQKRNGKSKAYRAA